MTPKLPPAFVLCLLAGAAAAQAPAALQGAQVKDGKGKAVGRIEKVIRAADGRPQQVEVRVNRVLRTLPVAGLTPQGEGYVSVLSRAEVAALPPSN
jgi:hypothetical protein